MKNLKTFDPSEYLETPEDISYFLESALESNDSRVIAAALGEIAKAKGMSEIAEAAGLTRASLYKSLSADGNPEFATVLKVTSALGLKLQACPA